MTRARAQRLRREASALERKAWAALKTLRGEGVYIRRQHPVGRFVADFAIMRVRLAIEIDGPLHEEAERRAKDKERDAAFALLGWRVLRFTTMQVDDDLNFLASVRAALSPSPRGEGAGGGAKPGLADLNADESSAPSIEDGGIRPAPLPPPLAGRGNEAAPRLRRTRGHRVLPSRRQP